MNFRAFREEYEVEGVGDLIYELVIELASTVCRSYPTAVYNNGLAWDESSIGDLAQETVLNQLLIEGQLDYIFNVSSSLESVRRLLTRQVKRALHRRRLITPIDRLVKRVVSLVDSGHLERVPGSTSTYRLPNSASEWRAITPQQVSAAIDAASVVPVLFSRIDTTRETQIYSTPALKQVLSAFFSVCPALTEQEIRTIFEKLLTPWAPTTLVPIEEIIDPLEQPMTESTLSEIDAAASAWVDNLTLEECSVFYYRSRELPDAVTAERINKSRATVVNIKQRVLESAGGQLLADVDPRFHPDVVRLAQEHCARRLGETL